MELAKALQITACLLLLHRANAFLPSRAARSLPATDYTLTELTVEGIVRAVARYFEDSNPDRYSPGNLTGLSPLTPSLLFQEHYGDCVYATKFERAIDAIVNKNLQVSRLSAHKAVWHFNGNQINAGNRKMIGLRDTLLDLLSGGDENAPDYDLARVHIGQFLHMAQSFYSNTNWIELNRQFEQDPDAIKTSSDLGIVDPLLLPQSPENEDMCKNCIGPSLIPELQDCSDNLRQYVAYLTSGYRDRQDVTKPVAEEGSEWGKCSHGGMSDMSSIRVAIGGINKESSDPRLSPHHTLHQQAAMTALKATEDFFYHPDTGLYALIGEQKFRKLLNLDTGTSLTFVIDTTGSMSNEIQAVKDEAIRLVNIHRGTCLAASRYVVAPFNDPEFGPALVTTDAQECIDFIANLKASGGGDCPEMANSGLELGLQHSLERATVYLYTDASDKDSHKLPDVLALIEQKNIQVKYLLTGECSSRRRKRDSDLPKRTSYEIIARASGGVIYTTDNAGIKALTRIIEGDIRASQVTITTRSSLQQSVFNMVIPVDSTTHEVLISVVGNLGGTDGGVLIANPSGVEDTPSALQASIFTSSAEQIVFSIDATEADKKGNWTLRLQNLDLDTEYKVTASANSPIDFNFEILEIDESGSAYPVDAFPVAGANVLMMIRVSAPSKISRVSEIRLHDTTGQETLLIAAAEPVVGRTVGQYKANISLPDKAFFVSILGIDSQGLTFLRTRPSHVQVMDFKLENVPGNNTIEELVPGGEGSFSFRVTNRGKADNLTISVSVSRRAGSSSDPTVNVSVTPTTMSLATGQSEKGMVTLAAADTVPIGTSVKVTLSVRSTSTSVINFLSVDATVFEPRYVLLELLIREPEANPNRTDLTSPTCTVLGSNGSCTADKMGRDCHLYDWSLRFRAADDTIVTEIVLSPEVGNSQSLIYETFSLVDTVSLYTATCCCPKLNITVQDGAGNLASCGKDFYTPVSSQIKEPLCNGPVIIDETDHAPPTCTVLDIGGGCTADQMSLDCHLHDWWMNFRVTNVTDLTAVVMEPHEVFSSLPLEYIDEASNGTTALYTATCCCPRLNITLEDEDGNLASCGYDHYAAVSGEIREPSCTTVKPKNGTLGVGAIVGIAVGTILLIAVVVLAILLKILCGTGKKLKAAAQKPPVSQKIPTEQIKEPKPDTLKPSAGQTKV